MSTTNDVRRGLEELPDTLKDAYREIYKRILSQKGCASRLALAAFRWIQCSYEPLCSETLLDAITAETSSDQGEFSQKDTITADGLLKVCHGFLIFDNQLNVFRFAHLSVDEYLETGLPKAVSHSEIARVCLSLLCTPGSWDTYDKTLKTEEGRYRDRHLLLYSTVFWPWHVSCCGEINNYQMLTLLCNKLLSEANHQRWRNYHSLIWEWNYYIYTKDDYWKRVGTLQQESYSNDTLYSVCVFGLSSMFTTIFKSKPLVSKAYMGRLLLLPSQFGDLEIARLLIGGGADISVADKNRQTPLHHAVESGHEVVARLLIGGGAEVATADEDGKTPLHLAARKGYEAVARLLIDGGADVSVASKDGQKPLYHAMVNGHEAVARLLIGEGADVTTADKDVWTLLHLAARKGYEAVARLLIDGGTDVSVANKNGQTPLYHATAKGHEAVARLLIGEGADVTTADKDGLTPLHFAAWKGYEAVARLLIDEGADVITADKNGWTPLHLAAQEGYEAVARLLIDGGADVSAADKNGWTPLHVAAPIGNEAVARLLRDRGATGTQLITAHAPTSSL